MGRLNSLHIYAGPSIFSQSIPSAFLNFANNYVHAFKASWDRSIYLLEKGIKRFTNRHITPSAF